MGGDAGAAEARSLAASRCCRDTGLRRKAASRRQARASDAECGCRARAETIRLGTLPGLRFDLSAFSVKPGEPVEIVFSNTDEMLHNLVVTQPGRRVAVVEAALALGAGAADADYLPATPDVLFATKVVPSGSSATLRFTAPTTIGEYPYVCTFPGHGYVMFGTMFVTPTPRPPVRTPVDLPATAPARPGTGDSHAGHRAAAHGRATVQRMFMPDAGPASIAVQLPNGYSYCWDAGACRFRYAWRGGEPLAPVERGTAKLADADIFHRGESGFPLRVGPDPSSPPRSIAFKGYVLDATGVPEFEYTVDGVAVRERLDIANGTVTRRFRTDARQVWFAPGAGATARVSASTPAERVGDFHKFTGSGAQEFTIVYTPASP